MHSGCLIKGGLIALARISIQLAVTLCLACGLANPNGSEWIRCWWEDAGSGQELSLGTEGASCEGGV